MTLARTLAFAVSTGLHDLPIGTIGHGLQELGIPQGPDDVLDVREILAQGHVMIPWAKKAAVVARNEDERRPERDGLEQPRRQDAMNDVFLMRRKHRFVHLLERRGGTAFEVGLGLALDVSRKVEDARSPFDAEHAPAAQRQLDPIATIATFRLACADVHVQSVARGDLWKPHREFVLPPGVAAQPVRHLARSVRRV